MIQGVLKKVGQRHTFLTEFLQNLCFGGQQKLVLGQHIPQVPFY